MSDKEILRHLQKGSVDIRPHQTEHVVKLVKILQRSLCYLDTSAMGLGKTYVTIAVAMYYGMKLLVVGPKDSEGVWKKAVKESGANMVAFITKDALRSRGNRQPKHGYLERWHDGKKTQFAVTEKFVDFVEKGGFLVIDEGHHMRNNSAQYRAAAALSNYIASQESCRSRFAILTATPTSAVDQTINISRLMGFMTADKLLGKGRDGSKVLDGLQELVDVCSTLDDEATSYILNENRYYNDKIAKDTAVKLFNNIIVNYMSSAAKPAVLTINVDRKNGYYNLDPSNRAEFLSSLGNLEIAAKYDRTAKAINGKLRVSRKRYNVMTERRKIEMMKVPIFHRLAYSTLEKNDSNKVIIGVHFIDTLNVLTESLRDYDPIVLQGSVSGSDRELLVEQFQTNPERRLIIAIMSVMSESISLHDTIGGMPRFKFFSPSFDLLQMYQACGRAVRDGDSTKSDVTIRFVYVKEGELERHIYDALANKSRILKGALISKEGVILPSDFEDFIEED